MKHTQFYSSSVIIIIICLFAFTSCKQETKSNDQNSQPDEEKKEETEEKSDYTALKNALTFYASFDNDVEANFALGDKQMYTVPSRKAKDSAKVGLHKPDISIAKGKGKYGDGLLFTERSKGNIYYPSKGNIAYSKENWSGAVSFWLQLDPGTDLEPGYCDPIQITDVSYNDAAIWVDFTKENPRDFRLGVIGDREVWNPNPEGPDNENPIFLEKLKPVVKTPPFGKEVWTHILINFSGLNTQNGEASLYMNGELKGTRTNITTPFTWDLEASNIYIGLGYIGLMDELSIFSRKLTDEEISTIYTLQNGVQSIL
ncbi:LamG-like jellyroll fold domain-containing protein [Aquimarina algicola]|uniref:LamG domain-containing protein n=1 Tax=Aquimarina algicola TaxID=2589995 RepID=A0A504JKL4_9FLAO|nr:LamG-like jellyroll fold domain-containing protein [Aquimarina algicola]TPN88885.1 LamG domain-containing protein [Aquimarina algicola]